MIKTVIHDGERYDTKLLESNTFKLDLIRDIKEVYIYDGDTGKKTGDTEVIFNFVGFISDENDDLLVSFPKHFKNSDFYEDSRVLFDCIFKHTQRRPDLYIGDAQDHKFKSNFPFSAFFRVYDYYSTFGLYHSVENSIKPNVGGRLSWKDTISRSDKYIINGNLFFAPIYYRRRVNLFNFVTDCMIFVIDYTIQKFNMLINFKPTGHDFPEFNFLEEKEYVVNILLQLRSKTFKDTELKLIDDLIDFFSTLNIGGSYYLKHYSFSSVWEDMVQNYLCRYFKGVTSHNEIIFDKNSPSGVNFKKETFWTNEAKPSQFISPDHYGIDNDVQLIFDAKYYTSIRGMDYKQIAYMFMLKDRVDLSTNKSMFCRSLSSLILPSEIRSSKIHFKLSSEFGNYKDFIITEEYLETREIMLSYLERG